MAEPPATDILLVEDDSGDVLLVRESLKSLGWPHHLHVVEDGEQALAFVRREGPHARAPRPQIILLDLNLPRKDGREVFAELRADPSFASIPIAVLTSSNGDQDLIDGHDPALTCYLTKPMRLDGYLELARRLQAFYLAAPAPPRKHPAAGRRR